MYERERSSDALLVLGSVDERVAYYAAELSCEYDYELVVFSGGVAHTEDLLATSWSESEAEHFLSIFTTMNGRAGRILLESRSQNTGQNATYTYELLQSENIETPRTMQIVTKPYMLRLARATFEKQWPEPNTVFLNDGPETFICSLPGQESVI